MERYRAWRFVHPDFDAPVEGQGIGVSRTGAIAMVSESASVRQSLLLLITTRPGERVMRPDYGCELYRLAFAPNDATTHGLAIHYVRRAIERWEPRVDVLDVDATANREASHRMDVWLSYRVRRTLQQDALTVTVMLEQGEI
ncbi:MAG: GPW/gp25 family protein [Gammaproteobacteria bacterium]|nr:GPW/gp25 family protein [Gammaproteobacteria bacterium]